MLWTWTTPQKMLFPKFCAYDAVAWAVAHVPCCMNEYLTSSCYCSTLKLVPLQKQFIIIAQYTDLSVHSIWENTLQMLWTCERRHLEPLVAALYSTLFPSYFPDVGALDRWRCGEWYSLSAKEKKGKKTKKLAHSHQLFKLKLQPALPTSVPLGSCKLMRSNN